MLGQREFRALFLANIVSMLGNVVAEVALTVLVYEQTRSPALAASVMALSFLPYLLGGALLGAAADRLPARRALVACDLLSAVLVAAMVIPGMPVAALLGLVFANGLLAPVYQGVRSAVLPDVLPPGPGYILGRSMMRMVAQSAQIVGYGAGGPAARRGFPARCAGLRRGVVRRLGRAAAVRPVPAARAARRAGAGSMTGDSLRGIRSVLAHRQVRRILLFGWLVPACAVAPEALAAPYASHIGQPARVTGFLLMGDPGRDRAGRPDRRAAAAGPVAAPPHRPGRAADVRAAGRVRGQPGPGPGPGPAGGLRPGLAPGAAGLDGLLIDAAPEDLRGRVLALSSAGLMFIQGAGFALWGIAGAVRPGDRRHPGRGRGRRPGRAAAAPAPRPDLAGRPGPSGRGGLESLAAHSAMILECLLRPSRKECAEPYPNIAMAQAARPSSGSSRAAMTRKKTRPYPAPNSHTCTWPRGRKRVARTIRPGSGGRSFPASRTLRLYAWVTFLISPRRRPGQPGPDCG